MRRLDVAEAPADERLHDGAQPLRRLRAQRLEEGEAGGSGAGSPADQRAQRGCGLLRVEGPRGDVQEERVRQLLTTRGHVRGTLRRGATSAASILRGASGR